MSNKKRLKWPALAAFVFVSILTNSNDIGAQSLDEQDFIMGSSIGTQFAKDAFSNEIDFVLFQERGKFISSYDITSDSARDYSVAARIWKKLAAGFAVSNFRNETAASIEAEVPHPFFFGFPRRTDGFADNVTRQETAWHFQAQYWHTFRDVLLIRGFIGPTYFQVTHDLVSAIVTDEVGSPFQKVNIVGHVTSVKNESALGYNAGFDLSFFGLRRLRFLGDAAALDRIGLAFVLRYSRGTSTVALDGNVHPSFELGGTHIGFGLRVGF